MNRDHIRAEGVSQAALDDQASADAARATSAQLREVLARTTAAAFAVSSAESGRVFEDLVLGLAQVLGTDAALIAVFVDEAKVRMRTLGLCFEGRLLRSVEYDVRQTPCRHIVGRASRFVPQGVNSEFMPGTLFSTKGFDAYAGYSILNDAGEQLGIIVALDRKPIANQELTEALLKIFAVRAAAELERLRAEAALAVSETSYHAIFESVEDAIFVHDWESGAIVDVNPTACRVYGWTREEMLRLSVADFSSNEPPYTADTALSYIGKAKRGETVRFEWHRRNKDGSLHWDEVVLKGATVGGVRRILASTREISDRKQAEHALRASEEQYRAIFNASADALVLRDADFRIVDVNATYERMSGWTRAEVLGVDRVVANPAEVAPTIRALHERALAGEPIALEVPLVRRDGTRYELELRGVPIQHRGQPHVLYMGRDVTERKRAELALRTSEEQYRAIFNASADALVLWDNQYRRVDVNSAYQTMYGWAREDVIGKGYEDPRFPAEYARTRLELVRRALGGEDCQAELEAIRSDGTRLRTEVHAIPFRHRGEPHVLAIARDITERKQSEEALRASEEQYRAIFNASADAMLLRDDTMNIVDANPAFLALCGLSREQVIGRSHAPFVTEPFEAAAEQMLRDALAGGRGQLEAQTRAHDGTMLDVEVRAMPMVYRGRPHVLAIARNITADRRAEAERQNFEGRLRQAQKMEAIGQLTGGIAHDFNNILASVMGYVVLAEERSADVGDAKTADYLAQALSSCRRARDLIQQMLAFSRGGRGEPRELSMEEVVHEALPMLRAALPSTLAIEADADPSAPVVLIDEVQAHQVLLNLAINARDAMPGGGVLRIGVALAELHNASCTSCKNTIDGSFVELRVADSGSGIDPKLLERIFDPFFTTKALGKGTGMGLSMVHGIVHEHHGHVIVETTAGAGTTFRILLPARAPSPRQSSVRQARQARRRRIAGRVLLVDDEPSVLAVMRETLSAWGLQITACQSAEAAERAFMAAPEDFDLLVTDHAMPLVTGIELAERLRARRPGLPWLLCTGYADAAGIDRAGLLGAGAVLSLRCSVPCPLEQVEPPLPIFRREREALLLPPDLGGD
jgi:PAS domain S-box-containing protein